MFTDFTRKERGYVSYGDNNQGKILGKGVVGNPSTTTIKDVMLVDGLKHNLLSISQFCDNGFTITFNAQCCIIEHNDDKDVMFKGLRVNNVYVLDLDDVSSSGAKCLIAKNEDSWLWHRRLSHVHFDLLNKIVSKDLVVRLCNIPIFLCMSFIYNEFDDFVFIYEEIILSREFTKIRTSYILSN